MTVSYLSRASQMDKSKRLREGPVTDPRLDRADEWLSMTAMTGGTVVVFCNHPAELVRALRAFILCIPKGKKRYEIHYCI